MIVMEDYDMLSDEAKLLFLEITDIMAAHPGYYSKTSVIENGKLYVPVIWPLIKRELKSDLKTLSEIKFAGLIKGNLVFLERLD